jgi:formyl-CoA transferase/succinyl-CoA--D-citramalate CoA-transferase
LAGIRVLELGAFIAGPFCGQLLGDLGAEIIKVEPPGDGDPLRQWGLHKIDGQSLWWPILGRNKRSVTIDLRRPEGQELARKLVGEVDILVENFRPGTLEKWNLDPERLREAHPKLIVARVSGFGQTGPYRDRAGFAAVAEAMAGLRNLTGYPDRPPTRVGISLGDSLAGLFAALGVVAALHARGGEGGISGRGQEVDVAITDSVLAVMESVVSEYSATGECRARVGTKLPGIAPSNLYPTADQSWVIIAANNDGLFKRLSKVMGRPELATDERYATHEARGRHQDELDELIAVWTATCDRDALLDRLLDSGVPAGPVYDARDVAGDAHFRERGSVIDVAMEGIGRLAMQGVVPKLSGTPGGVRWAGQALGRDTEAVLAELLNLTPIEIDALKEQRIV